MSLTIGDAPFGSRPGAFNFTRRGPERVLYLEDSPRWIRGKLGDETIVESKRAKLLHETGHLPIYYFPRDDVRMDLLIATSAVVAEASHLTRNAKDFARVPGLDVVTY